MSLGSMVSCVSCVSPGERGWVCYSSVTWRIHGVVCDSCVSPGERTATCAFLQCHLNQENGVVYVSCVSPGEKSCVCFLSVTLRTGSFVFLACHLERGVVCVS